MKRRRMLFVCVGNAFRSQMAEGFARAYGGREWDVFSAGVSPAGRLPEQTVAVMAEKGIDISQQFPKSLEELLRAQFEVVVNMSGVPVPDLGPVIEWKVKDPVGGGEALLRKVRDEIETKVQRLFIELRTPRPGQPGKWDPAGWRRGN